MGRHSRPGRKPNTVVPAGAFASPAPPPAKAPVEDDTVVLAAVPGKAIPAPVPRADESAQLADVSSNGRPLGDSDGRTRVHVLRKDTDQTQVLPRFTPPAPPRPSSPQPSSPQPSSPVSDRQDRLTSAADQTTVFARIAAHESALPFAEDAEDADEADEADGPNAAEGPERGPQTGGGRGDAAAGTANKHHRGVWVGLVVFWLLALGAGFICLASVGARATCAASDKGLDCTNTGSALAIALAACVIVLVGILSVHAVDARDRTKVWLRDIGVGIVVLAIVAYAGYRIIGTISG